MNNIYYRVVCSLLSKGCCEKKKDYKRWKEAFLCRVSVLTSIYAPSKVSKCGSPLPAADVLSQNGPLQPPRQRHAAPQSEVLWAIPLPEHVAPVNQIVFHVSEKFMEQVAVLLGSCINTKTSFFREPRICLPCNFVYNWHLEIIM